MIKHMSFRHFTTASVAVYVFVWGVLGTTLYLTSKNPVSFVIAGFVGTATALYTARTEGWHATLADIEKHYDVEFVAVPSLLALSFRKTVGGRTVQFRWVDTAGTVHTEPGLLRFGKGTVLLLWPGVVRLGDGSYRDIGPHSCVEFSREEALKIHG